MDLNQAVVAITGGAGGLGLAIAQRLGEAGAKLALLDMGPERLADAEELLKCAGYEARSYEVNICEEEKVVDTFARISSDFGALNGLVNCAGIIRDGGMLKVRDGEVVDRMSASAFRAVIDVNLTGTFLCAREAAAAMIATGQEGCIINISSISAAGNMGQSNYSAAKAGVEAMAVTWSKELLKHGIRSAAIAPGFMDTGLLQEMKPEALKKITSMIPSGRLGNPDEIAQTVEFILRNDYFSGRTIATDGGLRI